MQNIGRKVRLAEAKKEKREKASKKKLTKERRGKRVRRKRSALGGREKEENNPK